MNFNELLNDCSDLMVNLIAVAYKVATGIEINTWNRFPKYVMNHATKSFDSKSLCSASEQMIRKLYAQTYNDCIKCQLVNCLHVYNFIKMLTVISTRLWNSDKSNHLIQYTCKTDWNYLHVCILLFIVNVYFALWAPLKLMYQKWF